MSEADDLRKQISKRREAVTRKIARNRREKGVSQLAGSEFDPRISHQELKSYTPGELRFVLHEYNQFMSRDNQFVPGKRGVPLPKHEFIQVEQKLEQLKMKAQAWEASVGIIHLPDGGPSIAQQQGQLAKRANANQSFSPYPVFNRKSTDFASVQAIRDFEKNNLSKRNMDTWEEEAVQHDREWYRKIQEARGESSEEVDALSDFQFMVLWQGTGFLNDLGIIYDTFKARNDENAKQRYKENVVRTSTIGSDILVKWAGTEVPKTRQEHDQKVAEQAAKQQKRRKR